jgi:hypothetical protein
MFGLFAKQNLVAEVEARWLFDAFAWCLRNCDARVFYQESRVNPARQR